MIFIQVDRRMNGKLEIYAFQVKGAASYFIHTPNDQRILIDGGSNSEIIRKISDMLPFYSRRIDMVVLTGNDEKRAFGLMDVIRRYDVNELILPGQRLNVSMDNNRDHEAARDPMNMLQLVADQNEVNTRKVVAGDILNFGETVLSFFFPVDPNIFKYSEASPPDIIMLLSYRNKRFLFLGDASKKTQRFLISTDEADEKEGIKLNHDGAVLMADPFELSKIDVLFVSNNASQDNLSREFLEKVTPKYLIYSGASKKINPYLSSVLMQNRFDIKEKPFVRVVSDWDIVKAGEWPD